MGSDYDFEITSEVFKPDAPVWEPERKKNIRWPFGFMRPGQSFAVLGEEMARLTFSRMTVYKERNWQKGFEMYEIVPGEVYRCFRTH